MRGAFTAVDGLATVVLAAGAGRRFVRAGASSEGGEGRAPIKQLVPIEGVPMILRVLDAIEGLGNPQIVVLGANAETIGEAIAAESWQIATAADWASGQGASLRAGLRAAPAARAVLIVLGDLPWLRREAVEQVVASAARLPDEAVRAFDGQTPGHPVLVRGRALELARDAPDAGLRPILSQVSLARVRCDGLGVAADVDLPSDLDAREERNATSRRA